MVKMSNKDHALVLIVSCQLLNGQGLHKRAAFRLTTLQTRGIKLNARMQKQLAQLPTSNQ